MQQQSQASYGYNSNSMIPNNMNLTNNLYGNPNPNPITLSSTTATTSPSAMLDLGNFNNLLMSGNYQQQVPVPSGNGITLNSTDFSTEVDFKNYDKKNPVMDKF